MSEMKTLKEMEFELTDKIDNFSSKGVFSSELRAKAIKWIRRDIKDKKYMFKTDMIKRWKKRFNITEEDLEKKK